MKNVSTLAAILASGLALLATGCDRTPDEPTPGERIDNAATDSRDAARDMGDTVERKADQAGQAIDDASITATIKGKYLVDDTLKGLQIDVDTEQGVVKLTGKVQSDAAKELATQIAQSVEGVVSVDNQLTIQ
ncbi:MAG TPA: BON domain-containing protein [Thiobacillus sp.]|nr:BON domain-containing protein [Thiobacillus sp.]